MCRVCPHVHLSHISGHFQSMSDSRHFPTVVHTDGCRTIYCMYVLYGVYTEDISRIHIWGIFQNNRWGELCHRGREVEGDVSWSIEGVSGDDDGDGDGENMAEGICPISAMHIQTAADIYRTLYDTIVLFVLGWLWYM